MVLCYCLLLSFFNWFFILWIIMFFPLWLYSRSSNNWFVQPCFVITLMRKNTDSPLGSLCAVCTLMPAWVFSGDLLSFPVPKMCTFGELGCLHCPGVRQHGCWVGPVMDWRPVQSGSLLARSCQDKLWPALTLNYNTRVEKNSHFYSSFLNYVYIAHIYFELVTSRLRLYLEVWRVFVTKNMP